MHNQLKLITCSKVKPEFLKRKRLELRANRHVTTGTDPGDPKAYGN